MRAYKRIFFALFMTTLPFYVSGNSFMKKSSQEGVIQPKTIRVATFNVSMEADNYSDRQEKNLTNGSTNKNLLLKQHLQKKDHPQIKNIAEIIQRVRPHIILLNEFDFIENTQNGIEAFQKNYLSVSQNQQKPIHFKYYYVNSVNTGEPSPFDLDKDGVASGMGGDAWGFGLFPGHYGMVLLSQFPIDKQSVRTFKLFPWSAMPGVQQPRNPETGERWYTPEEWQALRLSSKSHWDIPVHANNKVVHILASHPTPPVFDGPENRNGRRNYDEIRFWADYIKPQQSGYIVDDNGHQGGLPRNQRFVILGDLNAGTHAGEGHPAAINQLLLHPLVNGAVTPQSRGAQESFPEQEGSAAFTAEWANRIDYVLPSQFGIKARSNGVFWPSVNDPLYRLIKSRAASSDHRLVWQDIEILDHTESETK